MTQAQYDDIVLSYKQALLTQISTHPESVYATISFAFDGTAIPEDIRLYRQGLIDQLVIDLASIPPVDE